MYGGMSYTGHYLVYTPADYAGTAPVPAVFLYHGSLGSYTEFMVSSGYTTTADAHNFIAVFPDAVKQYDYLPKTWYAPFHIAFTDQVLDRVKEEFNVDANRTYCTGFSAGAFLCTALAADRSLVFAAFGERSGGYRPEYIPVDADRKIPGMLIHGEDDPVVPINSPYSSPAYAELLAANGNYYIFHRLPGLGHTWRPEDNEGEWEFFASHTLPSGKDHYVELEVSPSSGGSSTFYAGEELTLRWDVFPKAYGYRAVPENVYLAFLVNPTAGSGPATFSDLLRSDGIYIFDNKMQPVRYSSGTPGPTCRNVAFPLSGPAGNGTVCRGELKLTVPASLSCRGAFAAVFLDAKGRAPSTDKPVEISPVFEVNNYQAPGR